MSMILISGGSGSGKSEYAEGRAVRLHKESGGALYYAATMMIYDEESRRRVERHRKMRESKGFATVEIPVHIASLPAAAATRCLSNVFPICSPMKCMSRPARATAVSALL